MTRFALTLEFDGGPFMGLQRQDHGPSVQEAVERAVYEVTGDAEFHARLSEVYARLGDEALSSWERRRAQAAARR